GLGVRTGVHLMTSASGVATAEGAVARPVNLLMSGPVAGVVGGIWAGRQAGYDNVITLDVGGTSADIGLAQEGRLRMKHLLDTKVGPYQAMIPMVDVDTIGAGGGSIAYVDAGGIFRVGPRSAGADPGPAAYGRGGTEPTATDAMVNLGWLQPQAFLGVTAALGLLATDMVYEYVSTVYQRISKLDAGALQTAFEELEEQARAQLELDGIGADRMLIQRVADCRYLGQGYELRVDVE